MSPAWTIRRPMVYGLILVNALLLGVIFYLAPRAMLRVHVPASSAALPVLATPAPFELIRENGEKFSSASLKGHPWVADFIFTRCPNQCPAMSFRFAALQKMLPAGVRLVSFSVDPDYDTPERLLQYARRFGAVPEKWVFLTGDIKTIHHVQSDLLLVKPEEQDPGLHSLRFVLMDGEGRARGYYDSEESATLAKIKKDLKKLKTP